MKCVLPPQIHLSRHKVSHVRGANQFLCEPMRWEGGGGVRPMRDQHWLPLAVTPARHAAAPSTSVFHWNINIWSYFRWVLTSSTVSEISIDYVSSISRQIFLLGICLIILQRKLPHLLISWVSEELMLRLKRRKMNTVCIYTHGLRCMRMLITDLSVCESVGEGKKCRVGVLFSWFLMN